MNTKNKIKRFTLQQETKSQKFKNLKSNVTRDRIINLQNSMGIRANIVLQK